MFIEQQISILEWFLKNQTLKTGVMMLTIQLYITGINYTLKYIQKKKKTFQAAIIFHNITDFLVFFMKYGEHKRLVSKH